MSTTDDHAPVQDWATDFDHTDEAYAADPFPIWDEIRASECPIAHTERYGGAWLPTSHDDVSEIAYDTERFTSRSILMSPVPAAARAGARRDRPAHLLRPAVPPRRAARAPAGLRAPGDRQARGLHARLLQGAHRRDGRSRRRRRREGVRPAHPGAGDRPDARVPRGGRRPLPRLRPPRPRGRRAADRGARGGDDRPLRVPRGPGRRTTSRTRATTSPPSSSSRSSTASRSAWTTSAARSALLLLAGIDTTWSAIGASIFHLAVHPRRPGAPGRRARPAPDGHGGAAPCLRPRDHGPPGRDDIDFHGCPMKAEDWVLLPVPRGQPRPARVRGRRRGDHRPRGEPPRRLRARHPPLRRLAPRPHGAARGARGVARALPSLQPRRPRRRPVVRRPGARPPRPADHGSVDQPSRSLRTRSA